MTIDDSRIHSSWLFQLSQFLRIIRGYVGHLLESHLFEIPYHITDYTTTPRQTPASPDYTPASDTEVYPSEDHHRHIPTITSYLDHYSPSADDTTDSDTPDTPPSPTHGTLSLRLPLLPRSPVIPLMTTRKRVGLLPVQQLAIILSDLPITFARPSHKRRSPLRHVPILSLISDSISYRADLIPSPKRVRDSGYLADVEQDIDPEKSSKIDDCIASRIS
ncbi:hypothetical protein Tco_0091843 [Tanacetum coccineum]